jgi:hypothetical protein
MRRQEAVLKARLQSAQNIADKQGIEIAQALKKNDSMEALLKKVIALTLSLTRPNPSTYKYLTLMFLFVIRSYVVQLSRWKSGNKLWNMHNVG